MASRDLAAVLGRHPNSIGPGERKRFSSAILPPWCRKSPKISEVLPLFYLHGLSSGDFVPALEQFLGSSAGLSPATITRLTQQWQADHAAFMDRDLAEVDYVYVWADSIHLNVRLEEAKPAWSSWSECAPTAPKSWWRSRTATASPPNRGPTCCGTGCGEVHLQRDDPSLQPSRD